jgi:lysozyme
LDRQGLRRREGIVLLTRRTVLKELVAIAPATLIPEVARAEEQWEPLDGEASRAQLMDAALAIDVSELGPVTKSEQESLALWAGFYFPNDVLYDKVLKKQREGQILGIDISHYQPNLSHALLSLQAVGFTYVKASQGPRGFDRSFDQHWRNLKKYHVPRGAYHFLTPDVDGKTQAEHFLAVVNNSGQLETGDLVPVVDVESTTTDPTQDAWRLKKPAEIESIIYDWLTTVQAHVPKANPLIYTVRSWWSLLQPGSKPTELEIPAKLRPYRVWIADYGIKQDRFEKPRVLRNANVVLWQFTDSARLASGYSGNLDASVYFGSPEQFKRDMFL